MGHQHLQQTSFLMQSVLHALALCEPNLFLNLLIRSFCKIFRSLRILIFDLHVQIPKLLRNILNQPILKNIHEKQFYYHLNRLNKFPDLYCSQCRELVCRWTIHLWNISASCHRPGLNTDFHPISYLKARVKNMILNFDNG